MRSIIKRSLKLLYDSLDMIQRTTRLVGIIFNPSLTLFRYHGMHYGKDSQD